jgi:hypothetical protein
MQEVARVGAVTVLTSASGAACAFARWQLAHTRANTASPRPKAGSAPAGGVGPPAGVSPPPKARAAAKSRAASAASPPPAWNDST